MVHVYVLAPSMLEPHSRSEVDARLESVASQLLPQQAAMLHAVRAMSSSDFGEATTWFEKALDGEPADVLGKCQGLTILFLRLTSERGHGDRLLDWMDKSGIGDRYWAWRAAFNAYRHGEAKLMDVNPEVRDAATATYRWLVGIRNEKPEDKPKAASKRRGRRRGRT